MISLCFPYTKDKNVKKENIQDKNLLEFCYYMHSKLLENRIENYKDISVKNEVVINTEVSNISTAFDLVFKKQLRKE